MTKAEERSLERCPHVEDVVIESRNEKKRQCFISGYEQAEKDLAFDKSEWWNKGYVEGRKNAHIPARELGLPRSMDFHNIPRELTWEDLVMIRTIENEVMSDGDSPSRYSREYYEEILRRFNEQKNK